MTATVKPASREELDKQLRTHISKCLELLGYDLKDFNIKDTPARMAALWLEELWTNQPMPKKLFTTFAEDHDQMITLIGHDTWTRCPHHFERVRMTVSVAYLPNGKVLGLSKMARIADYFAKGLVLQERYVDDLASGLMEALQPKGVAVYVKGEHLCMQARGVETTGHVVTTALRGLFAERPETKDEFLRYVMAGIRGMNR
jgi:GTP cyclohydrolase I